MYGKINPYQDPAQFDGDLIPREKISAKNGRVVRMKYEIGDEDAEPIIISESYAKSLTSPEIKCDKVTGRKGREDFNFDGDTFTKFVLDVFVMRELLYSWKMKYFWRYYGINLYYKRKI